MRICAIGGVSTELARHGGRDARMLVDRLVDGARQDGTDISLLFFTTDGASYVPDGFEVIPTVHSRRPLWDLKHPDDPDWKYE